VAIGTDAASLRQPLTTNASDMSISISEAARKKSVQRYCAYFEENAPTEKAN
jgi:hypothetical protein